MYSVRQMDVDDKVSQHVTMDIFAHIYAPETREKLLQEQRAHEPKQRRLRSVVPRSIVFFVLAMALWTRLSQARVWEKLTHTLQVVHPASPGISLTAAALSYQRGLLGVEPLRGIMEQCCHPLCEKQTPGRSTETIASWLSMAPCSQHPIHRSTNKRLDAVAISMAREPLHRCAASSCWNVEAMPPSR